MKAASAEGRRVQGQKSLTWTTVVVVAAAAAAAAVVVDEEEDVYGDAVDVVAVVDVAKIVFFCDVAAAVAEFDDGVRGHYMFLFCCCCCKSPFLLR